MRAASQPICVTVDVEDWIQSTLDFDADITVRGRDNTQRMLDWFDELELRGTWFVQGRLATAFPDVVTEIWKRGHEVGCHADSHRPLWPMPSDELRREITETKRRLEDAGGHPVIGFRAPDFSVCPPSSRLSTIDRRVFGAIAEAGFVYDSSIVPAKMPRYGIADAPRHPFRFQQSGLIEIPLSIATLFFRRLPALGGGYLRLFPLLYHRLALRQTAHQLHSAIPVIYLHPYELALDELRAIHRQHRPIPLKTRLTQGLGRRCVLRKLPRLLRHTTPLPMGEFAASLRPTLPFL